MISSSPHKERSVMADNSDIQNGEVCVVQSGTHAGKSGIVHDRKVSKTGQVTITVAQSNGIRFKTLARNVSRDR